MACHRLQALESNLIYPRVVGKTIGLPGILVLMAVTVGSSIAGVAGILLSVPICSILFSLISEWVQNRLRKKNEAAEAKKNLFLRKDQEPQEQMPADPSLQIEIDK